jgi:hypothetical protein
MKTAVEDKSLSYFLSYAPWKTGELKAIISSIPRQTLKGIVDDQIINQKKWEADEAERKQKEHRQNNMFLGGFLGILGHIFTFGAAMIAVEGIGLKKKAVFAVGSAAGTCIGLCATLISGFIVWLPIGALVGVVCGKFGASEARE